MNRTQENESDIRRQTVRLKKKSAPLTTMNEACLNLSDKILAIGDKNNDWLSTANDKFVPVGVFGQGDRSFRALIAYNLTAPQWAT